MYDTLFIRIISKSPNTTPFYPQIKIKGVQIKIKGFQIKMSAYFNFMSRDFNLKSSYFNLNSFYFNLRVKRCSRLVERLTDRRNRKTFTLLHCSFQIYSRCLASETELELAKVRIASNECLENPAEATAPWHFTAVR